MKKVLTIVVAAFLVSAPAFATAVGPVRGNCEAMLAEARKLKEEAARAASQTPAAPAPAGAQTSGQ